MSLLSVMFSCGTNLGCGAGFYGYWKLQQKQCEILGRDCNLEEKKPRGEKGSKMSCLLE